MTQLAHRQPTGALSRHLSWGVCALALASVAACGGGEGDAVTAPAESAMAAVASVQPAQLIEGQYIVTLRDDQVDDVSQAIQELLNIRQEQVLNAFDSALKGFVVRMPASAAELLRRHPHVLSVEQDREVHVASLQTQTGAPYWLDRIDQLSLPLNNTYQYEETGAGVRAYVVDTGVRPTHQEITGRVEPGFSLVNDGLNSADCNGHGTHVSALLGGTTRGVAKGVTIVPVRVFNCTGSGSWSDVITGLDWVRANVQQPAVVTVAISGSASTAMDSAVSSLVNQGVSVVVAAGNNNSNACDYSPARVAQAITVGATTVTDSRASFSNFGSCLDVFAPGDQITSAHFDSDTAVFTRSGTSQAVPLVAGVAATVLERSPSSSPAAIASYVRMTASLDRVTSAGTGSPNLLLFSQGQGNPVEPAAQAVAIDNITGTVIDLVDGWALETRVTAYDVSTNQPAPGVTVTVIFSLGDFARCTTQQDGGCSVVSANMDGYTTSTVAAIAAASGTQVEYRRELNRVHHRRFFR